MIESIHIAKIATYGDIPVVMNGLCKFNFIFGYNGSGKTTISRIVADQDRFPECHITWQGGTKMQPMVYNRDFVAQNFHQSVELKGIFTLGENNVETIDKITTAKNALNALTQKVESLNLALEGADRKGGKKAELADLENEFKDKCWAQKKKHDLKFAGAFEGLRNNSDNFKTRVIQEHVSNTAVLQPMSDLEKRANTIFGTTPIIEKSVTTISTKEILIHETNPILKKKVIGKDDVDITAMIQRLNNSDWVREGLVFYDANEQVCPFCQQNTPDAFRKSLSDYFDESFEKDNKSISDLATNYKTDSERLQHAIDAIIATPYKFLNVDNLKSEKLLLDSKIALNIQHIATKKKEPSQIVELESVQNVITSIEAIIQLANDQITSHNRMVANLAQEKGALTSAVWRYILETELKSDLASYNTKKEALNKAITGITGQIAIKTDEQTKIRADIRALEKQTTSIQPTIDGINSLLSSFGFRSFSLAKADNGTCYKLVRSNGADAKETLSEGEQSFVTFLYFYHLLKGSASDNGMTVDRIVVFDDPVSSLDSDILFIVGGLIKGLFDEVREEAGHIKQIFVLTHNVYFHKEVTFNIKRTNDAMKEESFWVVRKSGLASQIEKHNSNPIKTAYELLWADVRRTDRSSLTIQNTLRRILENYFRILGGIDPDSICAMFNGKDKFICKSLFSWINAGSHDANDDLYISVSDLTVDTYLKVFKAIFEKTNQLSHYTMMMGEAGVTESPDKALT